MGFSEKKLEMVENLYRQKGRFSGRAKQIPNEVYGICRLDNIIWSEGSLSENNKNLIIWNERLQISNVTKQINGDLGIIKKTKRIEREDHKQYMRVSS